MKLYILVATFFLITIQNTFSQNKDIIEKKEQALFAQSERFTAMIKADVKSLKKLLTEDLSYAHTTGWLETKTDFINTVASKKVKNTFKLVAWQAVKCVK